MFLLFYRPEPLAVRKELEVKSELHKVKRITGKQVEAEALRLGDSLVLAADSLLLVRLAAALSQGGGKAALAQYPPQKYSEIQAATQRYGATLTRQRLGTQKAANPAGQVKNVGQTQLFYTRPIFITNALCLRCHGTLGTDVSGPDLAVLKEAYPNFNLTGYKAGDQIGNWQINFSRSAILHKLSLKSRKSLRPL